MNNNKDEKNIDSKDVIKISLMDLIRIIITCILVVFLVGYLFLVFGYKEDAINDRNMVVNTFKENKIENEIENEVEGNIIDTALDLDLNKNYINKFDLGIEKDFNGNKLTLVSYELDKETLVLNYKLKVKEELDYYIDKVFEEVSLINDAKEKILEESNFSGLIKVSDTEYEFIKRYKIDLDKDILDNTICKIETKLYEELDGTIEDKIGTWNFEIKLDKSTVNKELFTYKLEKRIDIVDENDQQNNFNVVNSNEKLPVYVEIKEFKQSDLGSKLTVTGNLYTNVSYYIEVFDSSGRNLTKSSYERVANMLYTDIYFNRVDLTSKIKVKVTEFKKDEKGERVITATGEIEIDLAKEIDLSKSL